MAWDGERVSALTGEGLRPLLGRMATLVAEARAELPRPARFVVHRPEPAGIAVERAPDGGWLVLGRAGGAGGGPLRPHQRRGPGLRPGAAAAASGSTGPWPAPAPGLGDRVRIGGFEFDYEPDDDVAR